MFSLSYKKRGFTLIEMLIVIVIIGILAAALIPRLSSARGRANDVARKADLAQIAAALVAYQIDRGSFPTTGGALSVISDSLSAAGMSNIPTDPNTSRSITGIAGAIDGQYYYTPISKGSIPNNGFILISATETEGGSNRDKAGLLGDTYDEYEEILAAMCGTNCTRNGDNLRYIYLY